MEPALFRAIEFDQIREVLAREALTSLGRLRVRALAPATEPDDVRARLALTAEAVAFTADGGSLATSAPDDLDAILDLLDIDDQPLEPLALLGLARFVESIEQVADAVRAGGPKLRSGDGGLRAIAETVASFAGEVAAIRRAIAPTGDVSDHASPALGDIRDKLRRQRAKLRSTLEGLTRGRDAAKYLQDQIVTDRHGRYVLVVRSEFRDAVPGIVHGASASGASLYVEPLGTVELNNDVVALAEREKEEIRRILLALTNAFRLRGDELGAALTAAADLDELFAKVSLARRVDGVSPEIVLDGRLEFRGARHPLLIPAVRDRLSDAPKEPKENTRSLNATVIASDLTIVPPTRALVISGPNTGGKTVALKAAGLLALMAQSGLLIPVEPGSRFTPFRTVFADIGDEQSISASLSTFSAHIAHIVMMDQALDLPALLLLDEVGSGTDPIEGGALGAAIIDHFKQRGALVIATTHDEALKSYAATTDGVATAGFGFDPDTYAPTYRMMYGAPGRSLALEIADRLGIPPSVIADARARRSGRESLLAAHLARVDHELATISRDRAQVESERRALATERHALLDRESRLTEREAVLRKRLDDKLNDRLRDARAEVDRIVGQLKEKAERLGEEAGRRAPAGGPVLSTGELGALRAEARAALGGVGEGAGASGTGDEPETTLTAPPTPGQKVFVTSFGAEGIVRAVIGKQIEIEVRGKRVKVGLGALRAAEKAVGGRAVESSRSRSGSGGAYHGTTPDPRVTDLVLIGSTVDEALDRAEKLLDNALLADAKRLRVVHGHGTGRLREALTKFFREHPLVASVQTAPENEGGRGATIVELKD